MIRLKQLFCALLAGAHLTATMQAFAAEYPQGAGIDRAAGVPLEWLPARETTVSNAVAAAVPALASTEQLVEALAADADVDDEDEFGEIDDDVDELARTLEDIAALARRVRPAGVAETPSPSMLAQRRGENDPLAIAREIVALAARAGDFQGAIEADWNDEGEDMTRAGVSAGIAARRAELLAEFRDRAAEFKRLTTELDAALRGGDREAVGKPLVALVDWLATKQTARGYRAITKQQLPFRLARAGETPVPGKSMPPEDKAAKNLAPPTPADTAETEEVKLTPEIRALALELGNNPVAIRNWVYNHIEFMPTHGSVQGAALTLLNRHGNAMDIASLTIALLRAGGVPSRYVYGVVEIPEAKVRNWLGDVSTAALAVDLMQKGQIPTTAVMSGGTIRNVRFEHVWVEAYVDFVPSRGARNRAPDQWVPLDASFKQFEYDKATAWRQRTAADFDEAAQDFARSVTVGADGGLTGFDYEALDAALQQAARAEGQRLEAEGSGAADLYDRRTIVPIERLMLEGALPYAMMTASPTRFSAVPSRYQHALRVQFFADETSLRYDSPTAVAEIPLARIGTQRLHVDNVPASAADAQAIAQYEALNAQSMPIGQINVRPELKLGASTLMPNGAVRMGTQLIWTTDLRDSHGGLTTTEPYRFAAGSPITFVVNHAGVTPQRAERETAGMPDRATLPIKDVLYFGGLTYWMLHDRFDEESALAVGGRALRMPSVGAFASALQASYFFGVPRTGFFKGYVTDVKAVRLALSAPTAQAETAAGLHLGAAGSLFEGTAWNLIQGAPFGQQTLSAAALLHRAVEQKMPIYQVDASNVDAMLARLQLSGDAESEIANAARAGLVVIAHQREIQHRGWSGSGYVLIDLSSGSALQRVEGGFAGGLIIGCLAQAVNLKALAEMMIMRLAEKYLMRLIAGIAARAAASAALAALLGPAGIAIGGVITIVAVAVSYLMAVYEVYTWIKMIEAGIESLTPEQLAELGLAGAVGGALCSLASPCGGGGSGPGGPLAGNPTAIGGGVKWQVETDYIGSGAFPLRFERVYSSQKPRGRGLMGGKWVANYFARLNLPPSVGGTEFPVDQRPESVLLVRPDGGWYQVNWRSDRYVGDSNLPGEFVRLVANDQTTGFEYRNEEDQLERYDARGRLLSIRGRGGETKTLEYDANGRLARVVDAHGRALTFGYDAATGYLETLTDPAGRATTYEHDDSGNLLGVSYPDGGTRRYHYENLALGFHLTGVTNERGVRVATWTYDTSGRVVRSERADGADRFTFRYEDRATVVVDPVGTERRYEYATRNDRQYLLRTTQPCAACGGNVAGSTYDGNGYVASRTNFRGLRTNYVRDARGLETSRTEAAATPLARTTTITWHPQFRIPTRATEPVAGGSRVTDYTHDERGNVLTKKVTVGALSRTWTWTYQVGTSLVLTEDGPRTDVADTTTYTYDANGNRATTTDAAGHLTRYPEYNAHGRVLREIDPNGVETRYAYDERQRLVRVERGAEITRYEYDRSGNLEKLTLPDGSFLRYAYDGASRRTGIVDALGNSVVFTLNGKGDITREDTKDPSGTLALTLSAAIDELGRVESETGAEASEIYAYEYDDNGNETAVTDPLEHTTTYEYDALDRITKQTDPAEGAVVYGYDAQDNLTAVTDPRQLTTRYTYSGFDELTRLESPDAGVTQHQYDPAGNLVQSTDARNVVSTYRYDALNRIVQADYPAVTSVAAERVAVAYDEASGGAGAKGRMTSASDRSGTTTYQYDADGRVTRAVQTLGGDSSSAKTLAYAYDGANGQLTELTLPSGARIVYRYSADGRVVTLEVNGRVVTREIEYFPYGAAKGWRYGTNGRYARTFDLDGRVRTHTAGRDTRTLAYDAASRVTSLADAGADRPSWTYGYDANDRLLAADNATATGALAGVGLDWLYDATGNRTQQILARDGTTTTTAYGIAATSNRLAQIDGVARQYDATGNTTGEGTRTSIYSGANRLVEVRDGAAIVARYTHNAFGERVCKATAGPSCPTRQADGTAVPGSGARTQFVHDDEGRLVGEYDATGALIAEHVWLDETPVATLRPAASAATHGGTVAGNVAVYYVHPDHLDTPRVVVNENDQLVWRWDSTPFGDTAAQESPEGLGAFVYALRFPGQYADAETGTYYNYFRDYEAATGRYAQSDPIGLDGGLNLYAYVDGEPLLYVDEDGLIRIPKPPRGPGKVPKDKRDKKRVWTPNENQKKLDKQCGLCGKCGKKVKKGQGRGHHKKRHADGGKTDDKNHVVVCDPCHKDIHSP